MWRLIIGSVIIVFSAGLLYVSFRAANFSFVKKLAGGRRYLARIICLAFFAVLTAFLWLVWNMMNAAVCMIHLVVFWLICDLVSFIVSRIRKKKPAGNFAGAAAIVLCAVWLAIGWYNAHHIRTTDYAFVTDKISSGVRIVQITDSHVGATFHADGFRKIIDDINGLSPDAVVITGDFVDDDTSPEDMLGACEALRELKTSCGVYYVFGNHDRGYYSEAAKGWTNAQLREKLKENGVVILEDSAVLTDKGFYIAGRKDRSQSRAMNERKTAEELLSGLDRSRYIILLDHQPHDFDAEAKAGADLVLCGHTHGGQFIPINHVGEWIGENALRYGHEKRMDTDFIVSSGVGCWTFKFKTGCFSEIVVIDLLVK